MKKKAQEVIDQLKSLENEKNRQGMQRFGIHTDQALGISMKTLRQMARPYKKNHQMALELWKSKIHEARLLAVLIDDPKQLTEEQMEEWVRDIQSWDLCDQACSNLFDKWPGAYEKARQWATQKEEYVKRAGFVMMAALSVHDKKAPDKHFTQFLPVIEREATDPRNFVKKAVNWSLRATGKRNNYLNHQAIELSRKLSESNNKTACWIGRDALKELESQKVRQRLKNKT